MTLEQQLKTIAEGGLAGDAAVKIMRDARLEEGKLKHRRLSLLSLISEAEEMFIYGK